MFRHENPFRKNAAKWSLGAICALVLALGVAVAFPEIWFRSEVVAFVLPRLSPRLGYALEVRGLTAGARREKGRLLHFTLGMDRATVTSREKTAQGRPVLGLHLERFVLDVSVGSWPSLRPKILRLDRLRVVVEPQIEIETTSSTASALPALSLGGFVAAMPRFLRELRWGDVQVDAPRAEIAGGAYVASLRREERGGALGLSVRSGGRSRSESEADLQVRLPLNGEERIEWAGLTGSVGLNFPESGRVTAQVSSLRCEAGLDACFLAEGRWQPVRRGDPVAEAVVHVRAREGAVELELGGRVLGIAPEVPVLSVETPCGLALTSRSSSELGVKLSCQVRAQLHIPSPPGAETIALPMSSGARLELAAAVQGLGSSQARYEGHLEIVSAPILTALLKGGFSLQSRFDGAVSEGLAGVHHRTDLDAQVQVPEIAEVTRLSRPTAWAVPAPLNNLRGRVQLTLRSSWKDWETQAPFELVTFLDSNEQAFDTRLKGVARLVIGTGAERTHADFRADWALENVRLSVPRLNPTQIPRFVRAEEIADPRSDRKGAPRAGSGGSAVHYAVRVFTPSGHPVRVDTNLAAEPVPVEVQATLSDQNPLALALSVQRTPFEFFRRKGSLDQFQYRVTPDRKVADLDGRFSVASGAYQVLGHFYGSPDRVHLDLTSDPPVPEDELWAILLFGSPMEGLDADRKDSAMAASHALSQGAFGLASLYFFASTPIERVNYDPTSHAVSVAFRVGAGLKLELGRSESSEAVVGLNRRLGRGWSFGVNFKKMQESDAQSRSARVGAGVEWSTRY